MRIPYKCHAGYWLPMCDVTILGAGFDVIVPAVIDSGAVWPIFSRWAAEQAGLAVESGTSTKVFFGGSSTDGKLVRTSVLIDHRRFELEIVYVPHELESGYALLGRLSVFDQFNQVAFHERDRDRKSVLFRD